MSANDHTVEDNVLQFVVKDLTTLHTIRTMKQKYANYIPFTLSQYSTGDPACLFQLHINQLQNLNLLIPSNFYKLLLPLVHYTL